jgi:putative intracellular protease/amidase
MRCRPAWRRDTSTPLSPSASPTSTIARRTREVDASTRLDNPIDLSAWFPERPYFSAQNFAHELEAYFTARDAAWEELKQYDALLMVGGSGPIIDMVNNQRLHDVILGFRHHHKLIVAECYAVTCLAFAREWNDRKSIIWGKHVTGHALEYDYKDGTGFLNTDLNMGPPPYPLEFILRDATGPRRPVPRRRRPRALHDPRLPVPHGPLHPGLAPRRRTDGGGAGTRARALRMVRRRASRGACHAQRTMGRSSR